MFRGVSFGALRSLVVTMYNQQRQRFFQNEAGPHDLRRKIFMLYQVTKHVAKKAIRTSSVKGLPITSANFIHTNLIFFSKERNSELKRKRGEQKEFILGFPCHSPSCTPYQLSEPGFRKRYPRA